MARLASAAALAALGLGLAAACAGGRDEAWVRQRVREVRGSDTEGWKKIPWTASLLEARRVSGREKRPVFLFTHDGNIETGRC